MSRRGWLVLAGLAAAYSPIVALAIIQPSGVAPRWLQIALKVLIFVMVVLLIVFVVLAVRYIFPRDDE